MKAHLSKDNLMKTIIGILMLALLIGMAVFHFVQTDKAYSSKEKRTLQQLPELTLETLTDGSWMEKMGIYLADQFPLRDTWMAFESNFSVLLGKTQSNGVYYSQNDRLIEQFETPDVVLRQKTLDAVNQFGENIPNSHLYFCLVPTAITIYEEDLPLFVEDGIEQSYLDAFSEGLSEHIQFIAVTDALKNQKETGTSVYYRTDHHWTTEGAYAAYKEIAQTIGWETAELDKGVVCNQFRGSLSASSGYSTHNLDAITLYQNEKTSVFVHHGDTREVTSSLYDIEKLDSDNPYEVFLGGNESTITIETSAEADRTLLLFKDSYANALIPFLIDHYSTIQVVDPRYYNDSLEALFTQYQYDDVLFLYNANTLSKSEDLCILLGDKKFE